MADFWRNKNNNVDFWAQQGNIKKDVMDKQRLEDQDYLKYRQKERADNLTRDAREAQYKIEDELWRKNNIKETGEFFHDFGYGFKKAYQNIGKPFLKYSAKVASYIPHPATQSYSKIADGGSQVLDKLI